MKDINKGATIGLLIEIVALIVMGVLMLNNQIIPSILTWIFGFGLIISLGSTFISLQKKAED